MNPLQFLVQLGEVARVLLAKNDVKARREGIFGVDCVRKIAGSRREVRSLKAIQVLLKQLYAVIQ